MAALMHEQFDEIATYLPTYLSVRPSVCLEICLSVCLEICLSVCLKLFVNIDSIISTAFMKLMKLLDEIN